MDEPVGSLDEIRALLAHLPGPDPEAGAAARLRQAQLTKPAGSLGRLEELAIWLAAWQGRHPPAVDHPRVAVFAANHGDAARGVSAYPAAVTAHVRWTIDRIVELAPQLARRIGRSCTSNDPFRRYPGRCSPGVSHCTLRPRSSWSSFRSASA